MKHGSLFSGIGGFDLAAEWMGWENVFHCEINPFCQKVLKYHFPNAESFLDITKTDFTKYNGAIDIISGGFPCQPYSLAGKRKGKEDERHLWPEMLRAIREVQPRWVVGENVFGLVNWSGGLVFHEVQTDLEAEGYEVFPYVLPACAVNAPHRRDRVWFVAYSNGSRNRNIREQNREANSLQGIGREAVHAGQSFGTDTRIITDTGLQRQKERQQQPMEFEQLCKEWDATNPHGDGCIGSNSEHEKHTGEGREHALSELEPVVTPDTNSNGLQRGRQQEFREKTERQTEQLYAWGAQDAWQNFPSQPPLCSGNDGLPDELDGITFSKWRNESIKAFGNAIVPQVAYEIFKAIEQTEKQF